MPRGLGLDSLKLDVGPGPGVGEDLACTLAYPLHADELKDCRP
jgi:hypothetical protein